MRRPDDDARTTFAPELAPPSARDARVRQSAASPPRIILRLIAAPFLAAAAALAGLLFAALLPICGIATISEGIAKASWRFVRETLEHLPRRHAHRV